MNLSQLEKEYLLTSDSKAVEILLWLVHKADNGFLHTTLRDVAKECGTTKVTVNKVFQRLYAGNFLRKVRNGQYQLLQLGENDEKSSNQES